MNKVTIAYIFRFSGTTSRKEYLFSLLSYILGIFLLLIFNKLTANTISDSNLVFSTITILFFLIFSYSFASFNWRRLADIGRGGVWILLLLIPYGIFILAPVLLFYPSTQKRFSIKISLSLVCYHRY